MNERKAARYGMAPPPCLTRRRSWRRWAAAYKSLLSAAALVPAAGFAAAPPTQPLDVAFFYGHDIPFRELGHYEYVVVQPGDLSPRVLSELAARTRPVAYVSVGEAELGSVVEPSWVLGHNRAWDTRVMDLTAAGWRRQLLRRFAGLVEQGFDAFFLDTLDSYQPFADTDEASRRQVRALAGIIHEVNRLWPEAALILNRGFEVIPTVGDAVTGVVAESLFRGWDNGAGQYVDVPDEGRSWLMAQLERVREQGLPVVVIDYAPENERDAARELARRIAALGFTPFVSVPELDMLGIGRLEVVPRRVLALYDSGVRPLAHSLVASLAAPVLEYLGYAVDYWDLQEPLPEYPLTGRYAGVLTWLDDEQIRDGRHFDDWLSRRVVGSVPLVMLGGIPTRSQDLLERLGIAVQAGRPQGELVISALADIVRTGEAIPRPRRLIVAPWRNTSPGNEILFGFRDERGRSWDPVLVGSWGGMATDPYVLEPLLGEHRWLLDPFAFFAAALAAPAFPRPDPTTENGRRILTAHIDGDGFVSRTEWPDGPYTAAVIRERVLDRYRVPTTVSIIEGEIGPAGLYPDQSPALEALAREIFGLPHVEAASHSYSHPFIWDLEILGGAGEEGPYDANLPLPGYVFDLKREVDGSVRYMEERLLPPDKKVRVFLWTGDALPRPEAVALVTERGLANLNGGHSTVTHRYPSITGVSPTVRPTEGGLQFYAPVMNENVYTNDWTGPFYGFRDVIETFELTGAPRRIKPISIYYHFYSGAKRASLDSLEEVYDWALGQEHLALWISEYVERLTGFHWATLARDLDGGWQVRELHGLRTLRLPPGMEPPRVLGAVGVAGWRDTAVGRYVHLSAPFVQFDTGADSSGAVILEQASVPLLHWRPLSAGTVQVRLAGHEPVAFRVRAPGSCRLTLAETGTLTANAGGFELASEDTGDATLDCR